MTGEMKQQQTPGAESRRLRQSETENKVEQIT